MKKKLRIAVATNGKKGLEDTVSEVFGRANTFTIADIEDGETQVLKIIENPALSYEHGAGPIAVKELVDSKVDLVIGPQLGHGASSILKHHGITISLTKGGTKVTQAVEVITCAHTRGDDKNENRKGNQRTSRETEKAKKN